MPLSPIASRWAKENGRNSVCLAGKADMGFSVSESSRGAVIRHIRHHRRISFQVQFLALLTKT
jgi:hypothetical protein